MTHTGVSCKAVIWVHPSAAAPPAEDPRLRCAVNGARTVVTEVAQSATPILTTSVRRCANNDCPTNPR